MRLSKLVQLVAVAGAATSATSSARAAKEPSSYVLAFAGDRDEKESDFFAVIDVRQKSPSRGKVVGILLLTLMVDLAYAFLDPRIRHVYTAAPGLRPRRSSGPASAPAAAPAAPTA